MSDVSDTGPVPKPALADVRVLDISNFLAAPLCSMFLADFGADVVKIEQPGRGDEIRYWGHDKDGVGLYYKVVNRGKRSVTADLRTPLGVEIVKRLARDVDVVVENYRPGTLERWGLDYETLSAENPGLILVRVSGFGQTGPNSRRPGFGTLAEAYAGYAHISGHPDGPPLLPAFGLADSTTGLMAAYLTMVALHEQRRTGRGQVVDLAIYETLLTLLGPQVVDYDQLGIVQQRAGSRLPFTAPRNTYRTRDGKWVSMAGSAQSTFERICAALEAPELVQDPRFAENRERLKNAAALDVELQKAIGRFDFSDLQERFLHHQATVAPVNDIAAIFRDEHMAARQNIVALEDAELGGPLRMQNVVGKFSRTPGAIRSTGPRMGEHNREVLVGRLGIDAERLRAAGIRLEPAEDKVANGGQA
ncbi:CaiB/BaiF CoA transferase family protein [Azospirillum rugosum]|uniref:Formyl-CoA transferase n=1 Tax=Azospirillum rugosum TaxID=416170 RepID=A0ABS4SMB8_9PROT|nr:CoA transferase [Azospirillum rugosum]MBP2293637.1 formyl-CoA transferase [Azospirillum rugosum]MDQ0527182.1 formyl-CoA transferase [Azospirillum rugosum]